MSYTGNSYPEMSVVIPTLNRGPVLSRVLDAVIGQSCLSSLYEIIIVDDGSNDGTEKVVEEISQQCDVDIGYLQQPKRGAGAARNRGIDIARGQTILFLDSDLIPNPDVVLSHLEFHRQAADDKRCLIGSVVMDGELDTTDQARKHETLVKVDTHGLVEISHWQFRTGNASLAKSLCQSSNGFDTRLEAAEDTEFAYRLSGIGAHFYYDPSIVVHHYHPMNLDGLIDKYAAYGRAAAIWYCECPQVRWEIVKRYGVFAKEMRSIRKLKFALRTIFVNKLTVLALRLLVERLRVCYRPFQKMCQKQLIQYYCRTSFRQTLRNLLFIPKMLHFSSMKQVLLNL